MTRRRVAAVVVVLLALVVGGLLTRAAGHDREAPPHASPGMRLVGLDRVVVAVPDSWIDYQAVCDTPATPYVEFEPLEVEFCGRDIDPYDSRRQMGLDLSRLSDWPPDQQPKAGTDCSRGHGWCEAVWRVTGQDVALSVDYRPDDPAMVAALGRIKASIRVLPDGYTTVPQVYAVTRRGNPAPTEVLARAGLTPRGDGGDSNVVGTQPRPGTVVRRGSVVTLLATNPASRDRYPVPSACAGTRVSLRQAGLPDLVVYPARIYPYGSRLGADRPTQVIRSGPCADRIQVRLTGLEPALPALLGPADPAPFALPREVGDLAVTAPGGTYHSTYVVVGHP